MKKIYFLAVAALLPFGATAGTLADDGFFFKPYVGADYEYTSLNYNNVAGTTVIEAVEGMTDPALYAYLFRSGRFNDAVMGRLKGAQLPRIGWSSFAELQIPLPPLEVQKEIIAEMRMNRASP